MNKRIKEKDDIQNAVAYSVDMKNGESFKAGSAELRINKGLKGKLLGTEWVQDEFVYKNGRRFDTVEHYSGQSGGAVEYYKIAETLKKVMIQDRAKGVLMGGKIPADLHK